MPKIAKERTEENQRRIEAAALELFTSQGFHGTNNREIAQKLGVSTGTIYTYFPSKEAIYDSIAQQHRSHLSQWLKHRVGHLKDPLFKGRTQSFGFRHSLRRVLGASLDHVRNQRDWRGEDPAFILASVYLYFFTYFLMERHMQGEQHLGLPDDQATERFIDLLSHGLWRTPAHPPNSQKDSRACKQNVLHQAERDRIEYIRFLSGRLWTLPPDVPPGHSSRREW